MDRGGFRRGALRFAGGWMGALAAMALFSFPHPAAAKSSEQATAPIVTQLPEPPPSQIPSLTLPDPAAGIPAATPAPFASDLAPPSQADNDSNGALKFSVPQSSITLAPKLRFNGGVGSNPNDVRAAPPQSTSVNPTPGLAASVDLGNVTLGTEVNKSFRSSDTRLAPDGRPASSQPDVQLNMKLKF